MASPITDVISRWFLFCFYDALDRKKPTVWQLFFVFQVGMCKNELKLQYLLFNTALLGCTKLAVCDLGVSRYCRHTFYIFAHQVVCCSGINNLIRSFCPSGRLCGSFALFLTCLDTVRRSVFPDLLLLLFPHKISIIYFTAESIYTTVSLYPLIIITWRSKKEKISAIFKTLRYNVALWL